MLYSISTPVFDEYAIVDLLSNSKRFFMFFQDNGTDDKFLKYSDIHFAAQSGYTKSNINVCDYINATIDVPIFSQKAFDKMRDIIKEDLHLYKCIITCDKIDFVFYVGKIIKYSNLINYGESSYRNLTDGRKVLGTPVYEDDMDKGIFIARDKLFPHIFAVSSSFISILEDNSLNISYKPLLSS